MFHERGAYYPARHTARQSRNQKAGKHIRAGITPEDNVFARRATNLTISSTEFTEDAEGAEKRDRGAQVGCWSGLLRVSIRPKRSSSVFIFAISEFKFT